MKKNNNIVIIPVDNRPVSYALPHSIGSLNKKFDILLPPKEFLGDLKKAADTAKILEWLEKTIFEKEIDFVICSLDTIAYGGLIPSRRSTDSVQEIASRLDKFKQIIKQANAKVFAFSSIMRISDSNINEEEKAYWDKYGKLLFKYSMLKHKSEINTQTPEINQEFQAIKDQIPANIIDDYLKTRETNFSINKQYLDDIEEGYLDYLIYAKDDTAPFGINIQEGVKLKAEIEAKNLTDKAVLHTGCDEVMLLLLARALKNSLCGEISIYPVYSTKTGADIIPRYEDKCLAKSIETHLNTCGAQLAESEEDSDIILLLHTPQKTQNDFALGEYSEPDDQVSVEFCINYINNTNKPVILADVRNANGSDNHLAEKLFAEQIDFDKLYGYAGWNTASNSTGTALSTGISRYIAEKENNFSTKTFNKLLFTRFADDWIYQGIIRQKIRAITSKPDKKLLYKELMPEISKIAPNFNTNIEKIQLDFPWDRTFEVEIT